MSSSSRSIQAAQRRRAGPVENTPVNKYPQPSINSAQMFSKQGQGINIPNGRLAGQQATLQQQQMQQAVYEQKNNEKKEGLASVSKMSIPQAITLITLRLGALESKIMNLNEFEQHFSSQEENSIDHKILDNLIMRIDELEKKETTPANSTVNEHQISQVEWQTLKQQVEINKQSIKNQTNTLAKEIISLKTSLDGLTKELKNVKETVQSLKNNVDQNNEKIEQLLSENMVELKTQEEVDTEVDAEVDTEVDTEIQQNIVKMDLKKLIENELNNS